MLIGRSKARQARFLVQTAITNHVTTRLSHGGGAARRGMMASRRSGMTTSREVPRMATGARAAFIMLWIYSRVAAAD